MVARTRVKSFIGDVEVTGSLTKGGVDVALPTDIPTTSNISNRHLITSTITTGSTLTDVNITYGTGVADFTIGYPQDGPYRIPIAIPNTSAHDHIAYVTSIGSVYTADAVWRVFDASTYAFVHDVLAVRYVNGNASQFNYPFSFSAFVIGDHITLNKVDGQTQGGSSLPGGPYQVYDWVSNENNFADEVTPSIASGGARVNFTLPTIGTSFKGADSDAFFESITQEQILMASNGGNIDYFGVSVAMSADGNTVIVGAAWEDGQATDTGAAYIFRYSSGTWSEQTILRASNGSNDNNFGRSVAISADGNTVLVGASSEDGPTDTTDNSGAAYIFRYSSGTWSEQTILRASNTEALDLFGWSVDISADGNTVIVGAYGEKGATNNTTNSGAAYVFRYSSGTWSEDSPILRASNTESGDYFGYAVAMSKDGNTVIVGAYGEDGLTDNLSASGAAYVFRYSSGTWSQDSTILRASNAGSNDEFGYAIAMSDDGNTVIIGARKEGGPTNNVLGSGAAYVFRYNTTWDTGTIVRASNAGSNDYFGTSVAMSMDGNTVIVGAPYEDGLTDNLSASGAAYVFMYDTSTSLWSEESTILRASDAASGNQFGSQNHVAISGDGNTFIVGAARLDTINDNAVGAAYIFQTYGNDIYYTSGRVGIGSYPPPASITNTSAHNHIAYAIDEGAQGKWLVFDASTYAFVEVVDAVINLNNGGGQYGYPLNTNNSLTGTNYIVGDHITLNILTGQSQNGYQSYLWVTNETGSVGRPAKDIVVDGTMRIGSSDLIGGDGSSMIEQAVLRASNLGSYDYFGEGVAMSKDGNTVIVGAYGEDGPTDNLSGSGAAYVFRNSNGTWSQDSTILMASNAQDLDIFGFRVEMSADGNIVLVGARREDGLSGSTTDAGAAYVFRYDTETLVWSQDSPILKASNEGGFDYFGHGLAMSDDGNTIIVGAYQEDGSTNSTNNSGAAYVFRYSSGTWSEDSPILRASNTGTNDLFGRSVAMSGDGTKVIVGAFGEGGSTNNTPLSGAAYVFRYSSGTWSEDSTILRASNAGSYDEFGNDVAMSDDGNIVIVGAYGEDTGGSGETGAAYVFRYSSGTWTQDSQILRAVSPAGGDFFGWSVDMSTDGNTVIIGARNEGASNYGAAYVFRYSSGTWSQDPTILRVANMYSNEKFGNDVAMSGDGTKVIVGAYGDDGPTNDDYYAGAAYIFTILNGLNVSTPIKANGTILSFTGQHMCSPHGDMSQGLVVSANKNMYTTLNGPLYSGSMAINSSESLPVVSLSSIENDPSVFGVVDHLEESGTERTQDRGGILVKNTKKLGDDRVIVNSIGEGALWVVNTCGPLISGDLITTSNVHGYAQRQDGTIRRSYTIGKITMDCDFNPSDIPVQVATTDEGGQLQWEDTNQMEKAYKIRYLDANGVETDEAKHVYKAAYVGCTYHCG
jgi:hypothetical protein